VLTYLAKRKHDSNGNNNIQINSRLNADFGKNTCFQCLSHYIALTTALLTYVTKRKHDSKSAFSLELIWILLFPLESCLRFARYVNTVVVNVI
jgi:hypothetical protein